MTSISNDDDDDNAKCINDDDHANGLQCGEGMTSISDDDDVNDDDTN